jgi:hypothetical protein
MRKEWPPQLLDNCGQEGNSPLSLFDLLKSTRAKAVSFFKKSNTALAEWVQTCIFAAPHQNKSVEGSFNILDQILQVHENISPLKLQSIQAFLLNVVSPRKQQFFKENGKEKWRPTKKAMQGKHSLKIFLSTWGNLSLVMLNRMESSALPHSMNITNPSTFAKVDLSLFSLRNGKVLFCFSFDYFS